jgi:hypothetical protein
MPFGDGTGPSGMGPMTGRGAGYCAGSGRPGFANSLPRRWWSGFGRGRGMGRRYVPYKAFYAPPAVYPGYGYPRYGRRFYSAPNFYPW